MEIPNEAVIYLYGTVSIIIVVLLYIAYNVWRTKRMIKKEIESEY